MFAPCLLVVLAFGGKLTLGTIVIGLMFSYLLDTVDQREGTFVAFWVTLAATALGLFVSGFYMISYSIFTLFLLYNMGILCLLAGAWGSLHFRWLQKQAAPVVLIFERLVFAVIPYPTSVVLTWAVVSVSSIDSGPFFLMFVLFVNYILYSLPLYSSFKLAPKSQTSHLSRTTDTYILGKKESALHTLLFLILPALFYACIYKAVIFESSVRMAEFGIMATLPFILLRLLVPKGALWWTGLHPDSQASLLNFASIVALLVLIGCLEVRVVFHTFSHLIKIEPPWSYLFVTLALYSLCGLAAACFLPIFGAPLLRSMPAVLTLAVLCALTVAAVFKMPLPAAACLMVSAVGFSMFYLDRKLISYGLFVVGLFSPFVWLMTESFWFLDYDFSVLKVNLRELVSLLGILFFIALILPGVVLRRKPLPITGLLLFLHSLGLVVGEWLLFSQFSGVYSPYLVLLTSVLGIAMTIKLEAQERISAFSAWIISVLHIAKLSMLLSAVDLGHLTRGRNFFGSERANLLSAFALALTISPVFLADRLSKSPMSVSRGVFHMATIAVAAFFSRKYTPARLLALILGQRPTGVMLFASFLLICGASFSPLTYKHLPHVGFIRRVTTLCLLLGGLLAVLQPEADRSVISAAMGSGFVKHGTHRHAVQSSLAHTRAIWTPWLLFIATTLISSALSGLLPLARSVFARLIFALGVGSTLGLYICLRYVPFSPILYGVFVGVFVVGTFIILFSTWPTVKTHSLIPLIYAALMTVYPIGYFLIARVFASQPRLKSRDYIAGTRLVFVATFAAYNVFLALYLRFLSTKLRPTPKSKPFAKGSTMATHKSRSFRLRYAGVAPMAAPIHGGTPSETGWMAAVGNIACLLGFFLSVGLNIHFLEGSELSVVFLAPLLLLLNPEEGGGPIFLFSLTDENRYGPPITACTLFLVFSALSKLAHLVTGFGMERPDTFMAAKEGLLFAASVPCLALLNRFLWTVSHTSDVIWLLVTPPGLLSVLLSDVGPISMLGGITVIGGFISYFVSRHIKIQGLSYV